MGVAGGAAADKGRAAGVCDGDGQARMQRFAAEMGVELDLARREVGGRPTRAWAADARAGDAKAEAIYGAMLMCGFLGVAADPKEGLQWLLSASGAAVGAEPDTAVDVTTSEGPNSDRVDSAYPVGDGATRAMLTRSQMAGLARFLGETYLKGIGCSPDFNTSFKHYSRSALLGHIDGYTGLARMYERGDGIVKDEAAAFSLYSKAADSGRTPVNFARAKIQYRRAAALGCFPAIVRLAVLGLDPAYEDFATLKEAAETVQTGRCYHDLAVAYSSTRHGATPDPRQIRKWYRRAAKAGHRRSQWQLGKCYDDIGSSALGYEKELVKAFYWYHAAALQGYLPAQWAVSNMYRTGRGVEKDLEMAELWQQAANRSGVERAPSDQANVGVPFINSFDEAILPYWNSTDIDTPFNVVTPVNASLEANILGSSISSTVEDEQMRTQGLHFRRTAPPTRGVDITGFPSTFFASLNRPPSQPARPSKYYLNYDDLKSECEGYFDLESLLQTMKFSHFSSAGRQSSTPKHGAPFLQDHSHTVPQLERLESLRSNHVVAVPKLINLKQQLLQAEDHSRKGEHALAVSRLSSALRDKGLLNAGGGNAGGLLDLQTCYNWRLLTAISVQTVFASDPTNPDALFVDAFINSVVRPAELAIVYLDRALESRSKLCEWARNYGPGSYDSHSFEEDPVGYLMRAGYKARLGLWDRALMDYERAVRLNDVLPEVSRVPEVHYHRGVCYSNLPGSESIKRGLADVLKYLTLVPDDDKVRRMSHRSTAFS
ncbi:hypothetical protein HK405_012459 [Cladochytrium tenue]|nr:hypothetical protein HK405_012459 [Cladochytrium tenue]